MWETRRWALAFTVLTASGCQFFQDDAPPPENINVLPQKVFIWELGATKDIKPVAVDGNGVALAQQPEFTYQSADPTVATIDATGKVTAIKQGATSIVVQAKGLSITIPVTVNTDTVNISAQVFYQDRLYDGGGFRSTESYKPVRYAVVDILDADDIVISTIATDADGKFSISLGAAATYSVRVIASTVGDNGVSIKVKDWTGKLYAVKQAILVDATDMTVTVSIPVSKAPGGAYNVLDVMTTAAEFSQTLTNNSVVDLNAFWEPSDARGTYFCEGADPYNCPQGLGIYVKNEIGGAQDTDEYDDDVLWHEFGHFLVSKYSRDDSQGGCHFLDSDDLDMRLSWSEGWGDFFPLAVKVWLAADATRAQRLSTTTGDPYSRYTDTAGLTASINIDVANISSSAYLYSTSEIAISRVLWNINKNFGPLPIWQVLAQHLKTTGTTVNLESFWDGYLIVNQPSAGDLALLENIFAERKIYYGEDNVEPNDSPSEAVTVAVGASPVRYHLYKANGNNDNDYFSFSGTQGVTYTVTADGLINGTDTFLKVFSAPGIPLVASGKTVESDDFYVENAAALYAVDSLEYRNYMAKYAYHRFDSMCGDIRPINDELSLHSKVRFTAPTTGTYYVQVRTTTDLPPYVSAGRYGSYNFSVN